MAHQVAWTKIILERFIDAALLTPLEEQIMRTRCAGYSRVEQALKLGVSVSTVDRTIAILKHKYDIVQQYDVLLPPRQKFHNAMNPKD